MKNKSDQSEKGMYEYQQPMLKLGRAKAERRGVRKGRGVKKVGSFFKS